MSWRKLTAVTVIGAGLAALLVFGKRRKEMPEAAKETRSSVVHEAGLESFPASDPPPWTLGEEPRR